MDKRLRWIHRRDAQLIQDTQRYPEKTERRLAQDRADVEGPAVLVDRAAGSLAVGRAVDVADAAGQAARDIRTAVEWLVYQRD